MFASVLKFDTAQPRDDHGRWAKVGTAMEGLMSRFGADWLSVLTKLHQEGALPDLLEGRLDLDKLRKTPAVRAIVKHDAVQSIAKFSRILKFDESKHPRDEDGKFTIAGGRGSRTPLEQKRRNFQAIFRRTEHDAKNLDRMRVEMVEAWKVWADDTKNRKKPLKPDGAAAKKLESYKHAKALEDAFHEKHSSTMEKQRKLRSQALEMLKVPKEQRSPILFVRDMEAPLSDLAEDGAKRALEVFKQFDGSGVFVPTRFPAESKKQLEELMPSVKFVSYNDGSFSLPSELRVGKAAGNRAHATVNGIRLGGMGYDRDKAVYHEVAHHIEMRTKAVLEAAVAFRESQANSPREVYTLRENSPALGGDEIAVRGNFPDRYTGKLYPNDIATEVISTGVESYLTDPIEFVRSRPEHFNLIFNVMHGKYR